jgi:hypothetical protein
LPHTPLQFPIPQFRKGNVACGRPLRLLLKGVENVHSLSESGDINHAKCTRHVSHSDFSNALADTLHGFPIIGISATLNTIKLEPGTASWSVGKRT